MMHNDGKSEQFNIMYNMAPGAQTSGPVVSTGVELGNLSISNYGVGVATKMAFNYPLDGIVGLGFKAQNTGEVPQATAVDAQANLEKFDRHSSRR